MALTGAADTAVPAAAAVAAAALGWTTRVALRDRDRPNARPFVATVGALTVWALCALASRLGAALSASVVEEFFSLASVVPAVVVPVAWTVYVLGYAGRGVGFTRRRALLLAGATAPLVLAGAALAVLAAEPPESVGTPLAAGLLVLLALALCYLAALLAYTAVVLVRLGRRQSLLSPLQVAALLTAVGVPYLGTAVQLAGGPAGGGVGGLLLSGSLFALSIRRYPLLTGFPRSESVARDRVVEALREAVVVLDWDGQVLDANGSAARLLGRSTEELVGRSIAAVADGIGTADLSAGAAGTVTLRTTRGRRRYRYSVSAVDRTAEGSTVGDQAIEEPMGEVPADEEPTAEGATSEDPTGEPPAAADDPDGDRDPVARAVVLRDVTDRRTREQRLSVLNRILRHNVRNRLDVVLAHAERVEDETARAGIRDGATDLLELGEKAREAQRLVAAGAEPPEPVDLAAVATEVADEHRDAEAGHEITLSAPDGLTLTSHPALVRGLLSELVDNAVGHAGDEPRVEITVRSRGSGTAEMVVADDGPGIPERERAILAEGTESPLEHGRGVGLWLVEWAVTRLGGDLRFDGNDPRGSVVTVRLHDLGATGDEPR